MTVGKLPFFKLESLINQTEVGTASTNCRIVGLSSAGCHIYFYKLHLTKGIIEQYDYI
jgi:hypothetical protein